MSAAEKDITSTETEEKSEVRTSGERSTRQKDEHAADPGLSLYTLKMAWVIAKREIRSFFDSLTGYIVIGGTAVMLGVYFFMLSGGFWQVDRASMSRLFEAMPWILSALVLPLVTMRALAEEKRSGTLELLITMPVQDSSVILGKYLAAMTMCTILLAVTALYPLCMFYYPWHLGSLDWGPVWAGYLGLWLFCAAGSAIGLFFSSITDSQIISFFLTVFTLLLLQFIGTFVEGSDAAAQGEVFTRVARQVASFASLQSRYAPFGRGLVDTRNVVYFISVAILGVVASFRSLESRKWS